MKILIVEDNKKIINILKSGLEASGFAVDVAEDGEKGSFEARVNDYDLVILDINLPKKEGFDVCREIREDGKKMPILMLSVHLEILTKVNFLNAGADDYLIKPFSFDELLARVKALLRRPRQIENEIIKIDDIVVDISNFSVKKNNKEVYLNKKEFSLLEYFVKNIDKTLSRSMIAEHVWDNEFDPFSNTIEAHVSNLRRKLESKNKRLILTVPGRGYKMTA